MYGNTFEDRGWDPFEGLRGLQRDMNRLFDGYGPGQATGYPALNVWSDDHEVIVTAELPGVSTDDLDISVVKNLLTIRGERKNDEPVEGVSCHRAERPMGRFARSLRLPYDIESDKVSARYEKGIVTLTLPRAEATKPKRVEITTG